MTPAGGALALRLGDLHDLALHCGQPLVDVIFMGRVHERFAVTADECENFDALNHNFTLRGGRGPAGPSRASASHIYFTRSEVESFDYLLATSKSFSAW
jgi:hypothetical protein